MQGPTLEMPQFSNIAELLETTTSDYKLVNYNPMDSIKAPMAV
jgi:thymidylate synthase